MYDDILFPTDGSPGAEAAFQHARALAAEQRATLHVIHVIETVTPLASLRAGLLERGTELVDAVAATARDRGITVETDVREGDPASEIVAAANERAVDLVVMPTHGRGAVATAILGSVTDRVVRTSDVPVLVTRLET